MNVVWRDATATDPPLRVVGTTAVPKGHIS